MVDMPPAPVTSSSPLASRCRPRPPVIVTTPQDVALADARKDRHVQQISAGARHRRKNMSYHVCSACGITGAVRYRWRQGRWQSSIKWRCLASCRCVDIRQHMVDGCPPCSDHRKEAGSGI